MKNKAREYYNNGYSCSESIVMASIDAGICDKNLFSCATAFSGGISSGCLCGAVSGAILVIGNNHGKENNFGNEVNAREKAKEFIEKFTEKNKVTCCRALTRGLESRQKKEHCTKLVGECAEILTEMIKIREVKV